jgi:hypothetical protein
MGWLIALGGVVLVVLSLSADSMGIGEGTAIGYKQLSGAVLGIAFVAIGAWRALQR